MVKHLARYPADWVHFVGLIFYLQASCNQFTPSPSFLASCNTEQTSCVSTWGEFEGVSVQTRECGEGRGREGCNTRTLGGGARATICSCQGDKCNVGMGRGEAVRSGTGGVVSSLTCSWMEFFVDC